MGGKIYVVAGKTLLEEFLNTIEVLDLTSERRIGPDGKEKGRSWQVLDITCLGKECLNPIMLPINLSQIILRGFTSKKNPNHINYFLFDENADDEGPKIERVWKEDVDVINLNLRQQ